MGVPLVMADPGRTAERIPESADVTRALIASAPYAILATDADGRLTEFNAAAEALSGYRRDDVLGRCMPDLLIPERDRARFHAHVRTYMATGDPGEFSGPVRVPMLVKDGTERVVELTPVQLTINGQTIFWGIFRDLTEIERSVDELAAQTDRLDRLIASAIPGVLLSDENGTITNVSLSFGELFGIDTPYRLIGTPVRELGRRLMPAFADPAGAYRRIGTVMDGPASRIEAVRGFGYRYRNHPAPW